MKFLRDLKIRNKLLFLLFLLLLPLIYFVTVNIRHELQENRLLQQTKTELLEADHLSALLHQFQKERARIILAAAGDEQMLMEARAQRAVTDEAERNLQLFLTANNRSFPGLALMTEVRTYRNRLDQGTINIPEFRAFSMQMIGAFLTRLEENATVVSNFGISRELTAFRALADAKVQLGRARSQLMLALPGGRLSYQDFGSFHTVTENHSRALVNFRRYATESQANEVQAILNSDSYKQALGIVLAIDKDPQQDLGNYQVRQVFALFTQNVEAFRTAEKRILAQIIENVNHESAKKEQAVLWLIVGLLLILGLAVALAVYIINLISKSLASLRSAADRVRMGSTDVAIAINSQDEIGEVASAFRGVIKKNIKLTKVAQAIGQGNYDVDITPQSNDDVLTYAILDMKENLRSLTLESNNRNWILSGVSGLSDSISGETTLTNTSQKVLSFLCEYTSSEAGVLYLQTETGTLEAASGYGIQDQLHELPVFKPGAGKIGLAIAENEVKVLGEIPNPYLNIRTGFSDIEPATIVIIPLLYNKEVVGAIELCTRGSYKPLHLNYFDEIRERLALAFYTLNAHLKTQELLYETQNQAEELESQQEELRQVNAELKASEEELKVSQEELQEKNSELEEKAQQLEEQYEAIGTKNKALEEAREAIELKMQQVETVSKYKSEFLANMSHELRTPLNSILILSRLLADNTGSNLSEKQTEHAQIIHKSGADLLKLINEILDLSKIESGMINLELAEFEVKALALEKQFAEVAKNKKIQFTESNKLNSFQTITTDKFRLEQVLKNLVGNALKFTPEGGKVEVEISEVKDRPNFRTESLRTSPEVVAFAVKDTGIGIPKDKLDLIFEAFQQADSSTTRKFGGTGLGLAISRELAGLLGGEIMVESEPGKGSTFTLFLPRNLQQTDQQQGPKNTASAPNPSAAPAPPVTTADMAEAVFDNLEARPGNKQVCVLIVEDDKAFNDILADFAHAKNFTVHQAYTGNEGFKLARETKPDAVLLDIHLPDISGWEVLRMIRADKDLRHVNVHVMSAYDKEVIGNSVENEEYLPKPVTLEMLNTAFTTIAGLSDSSIETILIVEDNENENRAVAELLLAHNIKSLSAYSAEEAEQLLAKNKIDCIILDLNLPGMKGYEWMEKIRSQQPLAQIPIIIYSGKDLSDEEEKKLKRFANTVIIKNEYSYLRLLDEVQLFLHKVNQKLPLGNDFRMKLHVPEEILQGKKVLVVDDDVRNVYSLSSLLELHGINIVAAYDGKEALSKLESEPGIDMVLMDVMMPEMDGIEAITRIRQNPQFRKLPVIALTAKAMKEDREKCIQAGASDYIPKPVDTEKLLTLMRVWLYEA